MKKRVVIALLTGLVIASLAGCGTKTEATGQEVPESSSAVESEAEADGSVADESTSEEVIGDDADEPSDFAGAENESIVLYAEIEKYPSLSPLKDLEYESANGILDAAEDIVIYNGDGFEVGYIKSGSTILVTEYGLNALARFKNPIDGTDYDYLYVTKDYIRDGDLVALTTTELETMIKESLGNRNYDAPVFTEPTEDMELYEFRIPMYYDPETDTPVYWVYEYYDRADVSILSHKTYSVACTEDTDDYIICQIYYKDLITDEEFNNYGH